MIRIHRSPETPAMLNKRGHTETELLRGQYDANSADYRDGIVKFPRAKNDIYGAKSVRNALIICQNNKCCYSEARFVRDAVHVEHFRPKGAIGEEGTKNKRYPAYYWLAYDWSNLMLCKPGVNSKKGDYFPLANELNRAKNHHDNISLESPMFIDPSTEDPREHIRFHNEEPFGITDRGKYTVKRLLRHPELDDDRRELFRSLDALKSSLKIYIKFGLEQEASYLEIEKLLANAVKPEAEYSSMAMDLLN